MVEVTSEAGESFSDKMIAMVEGASRKKTPNEIALQIFLVALSIIFILVTLSLYTYSMFSADQAGDIQSDISHHTGGTAGMPCTYYDRCTPVSDRNRGYEPAESGQCAGK